MIRPSQAEDLGRLQALFRHSFGAAGQGPVFTADVLRWKYWSGNGCGRVDEREGQLVAHAFAWPVHVAAGGEEIRGMHCIDWAANGAYPGAGIAVFEAASRTAEFQVGAGGSEATHKLRPALGFREWSRIGIYARVVAPVRHALTHPARNWKLPGRVVRSLLQPAAGRTRWRAEAVSPAQIPADFPFAQTVGTLVPFVRTAATLRYWSQCPAAGFRIFRAWEGTRSRGYFCLTLPPGQARIVDAWTPTTELDDWTELYRLAAETAAGLPGVCELRAEAAPAGCREALVRSGFQLRREEPLMVRDRRQRLPVGAELHFQPLDGDGAFWHAGIPDYLL